MGNIIGFCGRCYSGKSELAKVCTKYGYELKSFGYPLKKLISDLLSVSIDDINNLKKVDSEYIFKDMDFKFISKETNIPYEDIKSNMEGKIFKNTREIMQFIGTDIIRTYNKDWHVNKVRETLEHDKDYVFDDVRFPNERKMIEDLKGSCWFIVRPKLTNISNHESETSLRWQEFDNVLVNDDDLGSLILNWEVMMDLGYESMLEERANVYNDICSNKETIEYINDKNENFVLLDVFHISKYEFTYYAKYLTNEHIEIIETINEKEINVYLDDGTIDHVTNPLILEDLKFFL